MAAKRSASAEPFCRSSPQKLHTGSLHLLAPLSPAKSPTTAAEGWRSLHSAAIAALLTNR
jgi:hypothetical protein